MSTYRIRDKSPLLDFFLYLVMVLVLLACVLPARKAAKVTPAAGLALE